MNVCPFGPYAACNEDFIEDDTSPPMALVMMFAGIPYGTDESEGMAFTSDDRMRELAQPPRPECIGCEAICGTWRDDGKGVPYHILATCPVISTPGAR